MQWALASATARVSDKKHQFLEVPLSIYYSEVLLLLDLYIFITTSHHIERYSAKNHEPTSYFHL